jgi:hypothetical protein
VTNSRSGAGAELTRRRRYRARTPRCCETRSCLSIDRAARCQRVPCFAEATLALSALVLGCDGGRGSAGGSQGTGAGIGSGLSFITHHAPEWDQYGDNVGHREHPLRLQQSPPLEVPKRIAAEDGCRGLCETEVRRLEKGELDVLVLHNGDDGAGCVESVGEEEEGKEVNEGVAGNTSAATRSLDGGKNSRESFPLSKGFPDLLPTDLKGSERVTQGRARRRLTVNQLSPLGRDGPGRFFWRKNQGRPHTIQ